MNILNARCYVICVILIFTIIAVVVLGMYDIKSSFTFRNYITINEQNINNECDNNFLSYWRMANIFIICSFFDLYIFIFTIISCVIMFKCYSGTNILTITILLLLLIDVCLSIVILQYSNYLTCNYFSDTIQILYEDLYSSMVVRLILASVIIFIFILYVIVVVKRYGYTDISDDDSSNESIQHDNV